MSETKLSKQERGLADSLVGHFIENTHLVRQFQNAILGYLDESRELQPLIHSVRARLKDPKHLKDKLLRKLLEHKERGSNFDITKVNLFSKINDLAGVRILHLHTRQFFLINNCLHAIFNEQKLPVLEGPIARTWDDEYRELYNENKITHVPNKRMYTSVHYVVGSQTTTPVTCEIQVRTLMEEVWGEVDHRLNYPHPTNSVACLEQIRTLARVTSSATRLVDAIFRSHEDHDRIAQSMRSHRRRSSAAVNKQARRGKASRQ